MVNISWEGWMLLYTVWCWGKFMRLPYEKHVKSWFGLAISWVNFVFLLFDFVFLWITLSNYLWNLQIKTFLLLELLFSGKPQSFCLQLSLNNLLYLSTISVKLYSIFLHFGSIFTPKPPMGELMALPHIPYMLDLLTKFSWISSEKIIWTLEIYKSNQSKTQ